MYRIVVLLACLTLVCSGAAQAQHLSSDRLTAPLPGKDGTVAGPPAAAPGPIAGTDGWSASTGAPMLASPKLADIDGDKRDEIVMTTYGIVNPYGEGWLHAWSGTGAAMPGFPIQLTGAAPATAAIGNIDGTGGVEIVQGTWNYLYVFRADGSTFPGWPKSMYITQAAALADLDDDGDLEIIVPSGTALEVFHHDGSRFAGFPVYGTDDLTSASVGDIDGDGDLEIVAGSYVASGSASGTVHVWHHDGNPMAGFPATTAGSVKAAPALADLDGDGTMEVIADCWNKYGTDFLYVWDHAGALEPGWPLNVAYIRLSSPSVADLDEDGDLEIVLGGWSTSPYTETVNAFHHDGSGVTGFPVLLNNSPSGNVNSTCTTADIDGDGHVEIVVKAVNNIYALNHDGTMAAGFPVFLDDQSHSGTTSPTPAIGDPDGDGLVEIFAAATFDNVILIDQTGTFSEEGMVWPTYRNDQYNSGTFRPRETLTADVTTLSASAGGVVNFALDAGTPFAGRSRLLLGGITGTRPGTLLPGGLALLPLNRDWFTDFILTHMALPRFIGFYGTLDMAGAGAARLDTMGSLNTFFVGRTMVFAFATTGPWDFASNAVEIEILP
jgi:hypothetical protein